MIYKNAELHNIECVLPFDRELLKPQQEQGEYPIPANASEGVLLSRFPNELRPQLNPFAQTIAFQGTGTEIRFNINSGEAKIRLCRCSTPIERFSIAEVWFGSFQGILNQSPHMITTGEITEITIKMPDNIDDLVKITEQYNLPYDARLVRVFLPYDLPNILFDIEGDITPPRPEQLPKLTYYSYGSSITHGSVSIRPSGTYAARIAQTMGFEHFNKACPGSAHMDAAMGEYLAAKDWDIITLEMGINRVYQWTLEEFKSAIDVFVDNVVKPNPDRWVFCTDMVPYMMDVEKDPKANAYRKAVKEKIMDMNSPRVLYIPGPELLPSANGLSSDFLHPSNLGAEEIALNFTNFIKKHMTF